MVKTYFYLLIFFLTLPLSSYGNEDQLNLRRNDPSYSFMMNSSIGGEPLDMLSDCEEPEPQGIVNTTNEDSYHLFAIAADGSKVIVPIVEPINDKKGTR